MTARPAPLIRRRPFLRGAAAAAATQGLALTGVLSRGASARAAGGPRVLVLLRLYGGNDGLGTVIPWQDPVYLDVRPTLRVTEGLHVLPGHTTLAFRPEMTNLAQHFAAGRVAVVQSVGYSPASLSHFRSEVIWQSADPVTVNATGWIGRYLDRISAPGDTEVRGFGVSWGLDHVFLAEHANVFAFPGVDGIGFPTDWGGNSWWDVGRKRAAFESSSLVPRSGAAATLAHGGYVLSRNIETFANLADPVVTTFPDTELGRSLRETARLIAATRAGDVSTAVFQAGIGGFDTHSEQDDPDGGHPSLWADIDASLAAFHTELVRQGAADDVLVLAYSEFGRRVEENGSRGTDHGTAAPMFAFGAPVIGGVYGPDPDLTDLDEGGNLKHATDFREVYATALAGWLGTDPAAVLGGEFEPVPFLPG